MSIIKGTNVLVTGGANGVGKIMGRKSLEEGCANLIIWDINEENLEKTAKDFKNKGYNNVHTYVVDVSDVNDIEKAGTDVLLNIGNIDILYNNAGIVAGKKNFVDHTVKDIDKTLAINVAGVMHVTRVFLPEMIKQRKGHIINISSAAGIISNKKMAVYVASKWAVYGWSESLRMELEAEGGDLHVTTVCPSYIDTGMFKGVKAPLLFPLLEPEYFVDKVINAVKVNTLVLRLPDNMNLIPFLKGAFPIRIFDAVANALGVYSSMDSFEGRPKDEMIPDKKTKTKG